VTVDTTVLPRESEAGGKRIGEPLLAIRAASKRLGSRKVLRGVARSVGAGEIYGLLGPNGAGKTTLVRAISGRFRLDEGEVRVEGRDPCLDRDARRALGLVPQEIALYPDLSVGQNLSVLGRLAGIGRRELRAAVHEALRWTGLAERARDRVGLLSGGMQRRLNLAAGTLHAPRLLLLDEPTVGVDPSARERIHAMLHDLRARGVAVLLTTHDLDQAELLADRVGFLADGRLLAEGSPDELVRKCFGDAKELTVKLATTVDDSGREALERIGLAPSRADEGMWSGRLEGGVEALSQIDRQLKRAGLEAAELRLREPGLRGVFFHVAGREIDS
jgi:ABC-2 type transport system ATP-binding protein